MPGFWGSTSQTVRLHCTNGIWSNGQYKKPFAMGNFLPPPPLNMWGFPFIPSLVKEVNKYRIIDSDYFLTIISTTIFFFFFRSGIQSNIFLIDAWSLFHGFKKIYLLILWKLLSQAKKEEVIFNENEANSLNYKIFHQQHDVFFMFGNVKSCSFVFLSMRSFTTFLFVVTFLSD